MRISTHISALLKKNNCVIIPDFGGFLKKEQPATFGPKKEELFPPSSQLVFQRHLQQNDNLLINHLVEKEQLSRQHAEEKVEKFVSKANDSLEQSNAYIIDKVGKIYIDANNNYVLKPVQSINYNQESYGLPSINPVMINRTRQQQNEVKNIIKKQQVLSPVAIAFTVAASLIALLMAGSLYFLNQGTPQEKELVQNSLSPFVFASADNHSANVDESQTADYLSSETEEKEANSQSLNDSPSDLSTPDAEETEVKQPVFKNTFTGEADFHVIVGVFNDRSHAEKIQQTVTNKGYQSEIIKGRKYFRVSVPFSAEKATWMYAQQQLSQEIAEDAWVWESRLK